MFILDVADWFFGDYPGMAMLYMLVSDGKQPLLLSTDNVNNLRLMHIAHDKGDPYGVIFHHDLSKPEISSVFLD